MPTLVRIPEVGVVRFPDEMDRDAIIEASGRLHKKAVLEKERQSILNKGQPPAEVQAGPADTETPGLIRDSLNRIRRGGAVAAGQTLQGLSRLGYLVGQGYGADADVTPDQEEARLAEISPTFRLGKALVEGAQEAFPTDPKRDQSFSSVLLESAGGMVPTIATGGAGRLAAAAQYGLSAGEQQAQEAIAAGQPESAGVAFLAGAPVGAVTEGALGVAPRFLRGLRGRPGAGGAAGAVVRGAGREAVQEGAETVGQNIVASDVAGYDPDRGMFEGVPTAMAAGAVLGGGFAGMQEGLRRLNAAPPPPDTALPVNPEPNLSEFGGMQEVERTAPQVEPAASQPTVAPVVPVSLPSASAQTETQVQPAQEPAVRSVPDRIDDALTSAITSLEMQPGRLYADPLLIQAVGRPALRGALIAVRGAYRVSRSVVEAVEAGVQWLRQQGRQFDEAAFRSWAASHFPSAEPPAGLPDAEVPGPTPTTQAAVAPQNESAPVVSESAAPVPEAPVEPSPQPPQPTPQPPVDPPQAAPGPGRDPMEERERKLSPRLQAADWLTPETREAIRNRTYQPSLMVSSEATAADLVNELGPDRAEQVVFDLTVDIPMAVRGAMTASVAREFSRLERTAANPQEAAVWRQRNADYLSRLLPMTTGFGQFINMLKAFSWQSADGAVMTAQRVLDQATDNFFNAYRSMLEQTRQALQRAHGQAITDTVNANPVQDAAGQAVNDAVVQDDEIRRLIRGRVAEDMEAGIRESAVDAGLNADAVVAAVNSQWGPNPEPAGLIPMLVKAGVPQGKAREWASKWTAEFKRRGAEIEFGIRQTLVSERHRARRIRSIQSVWVREREEAARSLVNALKPGGTAKKIERSAIEEFAKRVARRLRAQMAPPTKGTPALSDLQLLREAANNFERYSEVWDTAWSQAKADGIDSVVAALEKQDPQPFAGSVLDRTIRAKLKEWNLKLGDAVRRSRESKTGQLGDVIVADAGLDPGSEAAQKLRDALNRHWNKVSKERKRKEIDRILRNVPEDATTQKLETAFRKLVDLNDLGALDSGQFREQIRQATGMKSLTPEAMAKLRKFADKLASIPPDQQFRRQEESLKLMGELEKLRNPLRWHDIPMGIWYAHILSGWRTHMINALSNAVNLTGTLTAQTLRNPLSLADSARAIGRGVAKAWPEAVNTLATGRVTGSRIEDKFGAPGTWEKVDSKWALPWAMVGRALAAGDLMFFHPASEARQALMARAVARKEGLSGRALRQRVQDLLGNIESVRDQAIAQATSEGFNGIDHRRRVAEIIQQHRDKVGDFTQTGREFALATIFTNKPYGVLGVVAEKLNQLNREVPANRFIVPFTNIIANVVNESLNYTPVGAYRALVAPSKGVYGREIDVMNWGDQQMVADLNAKAAIGTILLVGLAVKAASHLDDDDPPFAVTGQGPQDASVRNTLRETGWIPNSIKVGKRYYSYMQTPAAVPLAVLGNSMDAMKYGKLSEADLLDRVAYVSAMSAKSIVDQSFLDSIARLSGAIERPSQTKGGDNLANWAARTGSSFVVPNLVRQIDQAFDSKVYQQADVQGAILSQIPFARRALRPALNGLGEPVSRPWQERFVRRQMEDPVWRELARLEVGVYPRTLQFRGQAMTDEEIYELVRISGPRIRQRVTRIMQTPGYRRAADQEGEGVRRGATTKRDLIQRILTDERNRAKVAVFRKVPGGGE